MEALDLLTEKIEQTQKTISEFKEANEKALKEDRADLGEHKEKVEKMCKDITEVMEEKQKLEARLSRLEALKNTAEGDVESEEKKVEKSINSAFVDFARKSNPNMSYFSDYAMNQNIDLKALSVNIDPSGGYTVMPQFGGIVETRQFETSPIRPYANVITISTDAYEILADNSEAASGGWVGETASRSETNTPDLDKIRIDTHEQYAKPKITQKLLDDSAMNVEQWLASKVADILSRTENTAFVNGTGVASPRGILTYSAWSTAGTYQVNAVEQVNSGSAGAFTADGIIDLTNSLLENYQANARFMIRRASFSSIIKLKDSTGNYLFNRELDRDAGSPFNLLGKPVVFASDVPAVGANALAMIYGDFRAAYTIVDRIGIRVLRDPFSSKPYVEFYTTKRTGGAMTNFEALKIHKLAA